MAWPSTALTTYVAGVAPAIQAFDLNAFQSAINGIINGTYSLKAVVVDGTGGAVVVPVAGTTKVSANLTENAIPGTARASGTDCIGTRPWGWGVITGAGTFKRGYNVFDAKRIAMGQYEFYFYGAPSDPSFVCPSGSASSSGLNLSMTFSSALVLGNLRISIDVRDKTDALTDALVTCIVWAE